jgi:hypothetical protein
VELSYWDGIQRYLKNLQDNIAEDVIQDSDEIKAFAELCLLKYRVEEWIQQFVERRRLDEGFGS